MLSVLGLPIEIQWSKFDVGTSIFIPCINRVPVANYVTKVTQRLKFRIVIKFVVENDVYGLRVWRI
jgi:hypothetical protein